MRQNNIDIKKIEEMFGNNVPSDRQEFFKYVLENIDTMDLLSLHNDYYCNYYGDDYIYDNDEYNFNEWMGDRTPYEVALTLKNSDWNHYDDFFKMDGQGNLVSFTDVEDEIDLENLADFFTRNGGIEDYVDESEILLAFAYYAFQLTDEEIDSLDASTLIDEEWDDVIENIIDNREEE